MAFVYSGMANRITCLAPGVFIESVAKRDSTCSVKVKNCYEEEITVPVFLESYSWVGHWRIVSTSSDRNVNIEPKSVKTVELGCVDDAFNFAFVFNKTAYSQCTIAWCPYPDCPQKPEKCCWATSVENVDWSTMGCLYVPAVPGSGSWMCDQFGPKDCFEDWKVFEGVWPIK